MKHIIHNLIVLKETPTSYSCYNTDILYDKNNTYLERYFSKDTFNINTFKQSLMNVIKMSPELQTLTFPYILNNLKEWHHLNNVILIDLIDKTKEYMTNPRPQTTTVLKSTITSLRSTKESLSMINTLPRSKKIDKKKEIIEQLKWSFKSLWKKTLVWVMMSLTLLPIMSSTNTYASDIPLEVTQWFNNWDDWQVATWTLINDWTYEWHNIIVNLNWIDMSKEAKMWIWGDDIIWLFVTRHSNPNDVTSSTIEYHYWNSITDWKESVKTIVLENKSHQYINISSPSWTHTLDYNDTIYAELSTGEIIHILFEQPRDQIFDESSVVNTWAVTETSNDWSGAFFITDMSAFEKEMAKPVPKLVDNYVHTNDEDKGNTMIYVFWTLAGIWSLAGLWVYMKNKNKTTSNN